MGSKRVLAVLLALVSVAGVVAAYLYVSNFQGGSTEVATQSLVLSGGFHDQMRVGDTSAASFFIDSNVGSVVAAQLHVNWGRFGIGPTDVSVTIEGIAITPSCTADTCFFVSGTLSIPANAAGFEVSATATINVGGTYRWDVWVTGS